MIELWCLVAVMAAVVVWLALEALWAPAYPADEVSTMKEKRSW